MTPEYYPKILHANNTLNSVHELEKQLKFCYDFWYDIEKKATLEFWKYREQDYQKMMKAAIAYFEYQFIFDLKSDLREISDEYQTELAYILSKDKKLEKIQNDVDSIKEKYLKSSYKPLIDPVYFYESFLNRLFFIRLTRPLSKEEKNSLIKNYKETSRDLKLWEYFGKILDPESKIHSEFWDGLKFKYLCSLYNELKNNSSQNKPIYNAYPLVFKDKNSFELFKYCIDKYPREKRTKTVISKFYELFAWDDKIISKADKFSFFKFIKEEYGISMKRIQSFTSSIQKEKILYENLKINFNHTVQ